MDSMAVLFDPLNDYLTLKENITCSYTLSPTFASSASGSDWIGLYKVGWQSPKDYFTFEWAQKVADGNRAAVTFKAKHLPGESDTESYQFCYVGRDQTVRGVSSTFRFGTPPQDDGDDELEHLEIEEDDTFGSLVVVRSKTAQELEAAREEASRLQSVQLQTATERDAFKERLLGVETERERLVRELAEKKAENETLIEKAEVARANGEVAKEALEECKRRLIKTENQVGEQTDKIKSLETSAAILEQQLNQMKTNYEAKDNEVDIYKGRIADLETEKGELGEQHVKANEVLEELKAGKILAEDELARKREEIGRLKDQLATQEEALDAAKKHTDALTMGLADAKGNGEGYVSRIHDLEVEVKETRSQLDAARQEANVAQENMIEILGSREELKRELEMAKGEIAGLKDGKENPVGTSGAAVALRVAHRQLEHKAGELKKERDALKKDLIECRKREQALKQALKSKGGVNVPEKENEKLLEQVADLTRRLQMGADVYKEKFMECHELQTKLKKMEKGAERPVVQATLDADMEDAEKDLEVAKKLVCDKEKEINDLKDKVHSLERELAVAKDADPSFVHVESESGSITEQMAAELQERRQTEEQLRERIQKLVADAAEREELSQENDGMKARLAEIMDRLEEAERRNEELRFRLDESDSTVAQQMQQIDNLQQEIANRRGSRV